MVQVLPIIVLFLSIASVAVGWYEDRPTRPTVIGLLVLQFVAAAFSLVAYDPIWSAPYAPGSYITLGDSALQITMHTGVRPLMLGIHLALTPLSAWMIMVVAAITVCEVSRRGSSTRSIVMVNAAVALILLAGDPLTLVAGLSLLCAGLVLPRTRDPRSDEAEPASFSPGLAPLMLLIIIATSAMTVGTAFVADPATSESRLNLSFLMMSDLVVSQLLYINQHMGELPIILQDGARSTLGLLLSVAVLVVVTANQAITGRSADRSVRAIISAAAIGILFLILPLFLPDQVAAPGVLSTVGSIGALICSGAAMLRFTGSDSEDPGNALFWLGSLLLLTGFGGPEGMAAGFLGFGGALIVSALPSGGTDENSRLSLWLSTGLPGSPAFWSVAAMAVAMFEIIRMSSVLAAIMMGMGLLGWGLLLLAEWRPRTFSGYRSIPLSSLLLMGIVFVIGVHPEPIVEPLIDFLEGITEFLMQSVDREGVV